MNLLVCGGRDYADREKLTHTLDSIKSGLDSDGTPIDVLIQGEAAGADRLAKEWAVSNGIHCAGVPALWDYYGRGAGYARNNAMLFLNVDLVVAFPGGRGTANMVAQAKRAGISVYVVTESSDDIWETLINEQQ